MKWLITGGCGFIGRNLVKQLCSDKNNDIVIVDNLSSSTKTDLARICKIVEVDYKLVKQVDYNTAIVKYYGLENNNSLDGLVKLIVADILDEKLAFNLVKDRDIVVHLAANTGVQPSVENPRSDCLNNVLGTLNYLEAAKSNNIKRFIFASSGAPIGECSPPIHEEVVPHPVSPYGASKLSGEAYCSAFFHSFEVKTVVLRFGNVYGPRSNHKDSVIAKFIKQSLDGHQLEIYGDGTQTRDFIYIDDLIRAIRVSACKEAAIGQIFQIATNQETSIQEITDILVRILSSKKRDEAKFSYASARKGDVKRNFSDTRKAKDLLGWKADVSLMDGIKRTVEWFQRDRKSS